MDPAAPSRIIGHGYTQTKGRIVTVQAVRVGDLVPGFALKFPAAGQPGIQISEIDASNKITGV